MTSEMIKNIAKGGLLFRGCGASLWTGEGWGPILVLKNDEEPVECEYCGEETEIDHPYGIKFRADVDAEPGKPVSSTISLSYTSEEKRDEVFDRVDEKMVEKVYKDIAEMLGSVTNDKEKGG